MSDDCPICMEPLDESVTELDCGHKFHVDCAIKWFRSEQSRGRCPMCRNQSDNELSLNYFSAVERYKMVRRMARNKHAPKRLKNLVKKLRKKEQQAKECRKRRREFESADEIKVVKKKLRQLRSEVWRKNSAVRNVKIQIALFTCKSNQDFSIPQFRCGGESILFRR